MIIIFSLKPLDEPAHPRSSQIALESFYVLLRAIKMKIELITVPQTVWANEESNPAKLPSGALFPLTGLTSSKNPLKEAPEGE